MEKEKEYTAYTDQGHWDFWATDHMDAMRTFRANECRDELVQSLLSAAEIGAKLSVLGFCFRDNEKLLYVVTPDVDVLRVCIISHKDIKTL